MTTNRNLWKIVPKAKGTNSAADTGRAVSADVARAMRASLAENAKRDVNAWHALIAMTSPSAAVKMAKLADRKDNAQPRTLTGTRLMRDTDTVLSALATDPTMAALAAANPRAALAALTRRGAAAPYRPLRGNPRQAARIVPNKSAHGAGRSRNNAELAAAQSGRGRASDVIVTKIAVGALVRPNGRLVPLGGTDTVRAAYKPRELAKVVGTTTNTFSDALIMRAREGLRGERATAIRTARVAQPRNFTGASIQLGASEIATLENAKRANKATLAQMRALRVDRETIRSTRARMAQDLRALELRMRNQAAYRVYERAEQMRHAIWANARANIASHDTAGQYVGAEFEPITLRQAREITASIHVRREPSAGIPAAWICAADNAGPRGSRQWHAVVRQLSALADRLARAEMREHALATRPNAEWLADSADSQLAALAGVAASAVIRSEIERILG